MYCIIDGNAIGYASQSAAVLTVDDLEVQAIFNSLRLARSLRTTFRDYPKFIWLWDGRAKFRYDIYPEYKGLRTNTPEKREVKEKYELQKPYIHTMLTCLGVDQIVSPCFEADDLAGYFVRRAEAKGYKTQLVTGDGDWMQLVSAMTAWHDPRRNPGKYCTHANFEEVTGFKSPEQFVQAKALYGDNSDNISGVGGLGEKAAQAILAYYGDVREMLRHYKTEGVLTKEQLPAELSRYVKKINTFCAENVGLFTRNYRLMNLRDSCRDEDIRQSLHITRGERDIARFEALCKELRFVSILQDLDSWRKLFPH